jgi:hypothetical protein
VEAADQSKDGDESGSGLPREGWKGGGWVEAAAVTAKSIRRKSSSNGRRRLPSGEWKEEQKGNIY